MRERFLFPSSYPTGVIEEGWYLMNTEELEQELARFRGDRAEPSMALKLTTSEALAYRNAGNLADDHGRRLRLVLRVRDATDLGALDEKRLAFEPDYHDAPAWRVEGSKPVNVVPLRDPGIEPVTADAWWEQPEVAALESEWRKLGAIDGVPIPADYRGFVFKTILSLRAAGRPITRDSIVASIARWLDPSTTSEVSAALEEAGKVSE